MQWGFWRIWGNKSCQGLCFLLPTLSSILCVPVPFAFTVPQSAQPFPALKYVCYNMNPVKRGSPWSAVSDAPVWSGICIRLYQVSFLGRKPTTRAEGMKASAEPHPTQWLGGLHGKGEGKLCGSLIAASLNAERHSSSVNGVPSAFCSAVSRSSFSFPPKKSTQVNIPRKDTPGALNCVFIFKILI